MFTICLWKMLKYHVFGFVGLKMVTNTLKVANIMVVLKPKPVSKINKSSFNLFVNVASY